MIIKQNPSILERIQLNIFFISQATSKHILMFFIITLTTAILGFVIEDKEFQVYNAFIFSLNLFECLLIIFEFGDKARIEMTSFYFMIKLDEHIENSNEINFSDKEKEKIIETGIRVGSFFSKKEWNHFFVEKGIQEKLYIKDIINILRGAFKKEGRILFLGDLLLALVMLYLGCKEYFIVFFLSEIAIMMLFIEEKIDYDHIEKIINFAKYKKN